MKVLVVDDSAAVRSRLCAMLAEQVGIEIAEAGSDREARGSLAVAAPQLVILDLNLGDGSGLALLGELRVSRPGLPVVVLTNHATEQHRRQCTDLGALAFFDKSTQFEDAVALVAGLAVRPGPS